MTNFGDLRSLVHQSPSIEGFHHLLTLVEQFDPQQQEQWVPYLDQQLNTWPSHLRACPQDKLKDIEREPTTWTPLLRHLNYDSQYLTPARIQDLLGSTHLQHITHLDMSACRISWPELLLLAQQAPFDHLKAFTIRKSSSSGADSDALEALFHSPMLGQLEYLSFYGWNGLRSIVIQLLEQAPFLNTLKTLDLSGCKISARRFKSLINQPALNLEAFIISYQPAGVKPGQLSTIVKATNLTRLKHLDIADADADDIDALANAPRFQTLRHLRIAVKDNYDNHDNDLEDQVLLNLFEAKHLNQLHTLELDTNLLQHTTIKSLMTAPIMESVTSLSIKSRGYHGYRIHRPEGELYEGHLQHLDHPTLAQIRNLTLNYLNPSPTAFEQFIHSPHISELKTLNLNSNKLTQQHIEHIISSPSLQNLTTLHLSNCQMDTLSTLDALINALPQLTTLRMRQIRRSEQFNETLMNTYLQTNPLPPHLRMHYSFFG